MSIGVIGVEVGVLVPPTDEAFGYYSINNPKLPFGFYDENQYAVQEDCFDRERQYVEEYVMNGVEGTYGVISCQGVLKELPDDDSFVDDLTNYIQMSYTFFQNSNEVLFSVCKKDGKLVEGFLETELHMLEERSVEILLAEAAEKREAVGKVGSPLEVKERVL